jgi:hypothetical protein
VTDVADQPGQAAASSEGKGTVNERTLTQTLALTTIVLAVGLALLWVTKEVVGIEGDAVFIALLLVPFLVYLAMTGKLESVSLFGASAVLVQDVAKGLEKGLTGAVAEVGQREAGRVAYLGKLGQILHDEKGQFALIYADVDGLRQRMRTIYGKERKNSPEKRRHEREIRNEILDELEFALTDAFYDSGLDKAKMDIFRLAEPDIAMIVRCKNPDRAQQVAELAERLFLERTKDGTATTVVVVAPTFVGVELTPELLDDTAGNQLKQAKRAR